MGFCVENYIMMMQCYSKLSDCGFVITARSSRVEGPKIVQIIKRQLSRHGMSVKTNRNEAVCTRGIYRCAVSLIFRLSCDQTGKLHGPSLARNHVHLLPLPKIRDACPSHPLGTFTTTSWIPIGLGSFLTYEGSINDYPAQQTEHIHEGPEEELS